MRRLRNKASGANYAVGFVDSSESRAAARSDADAVERASAALDLLAFDIPGPENPTAPDRSQEHDSENSGSNDVARTSKFIVDDEVLPEDQPQPHLSFEANQLFRSSQNAPSASLSPSPRQNVHESVVGNSVSFGSRSFAGAIHQLATPTTKWHRFRQKLIRPSEHDLDADAFEEFEEARDPCVIHHMASTVLFALLPTLLSLTECLKLLLVRTVLFSEGLGSLLNHTVRLSFDMHVSWWTFQWWLDRFCDVFFVTDIAITFCTTRPYTRGKDDLVAIDRCLIAKLYMRSWFFLDLVSSIPLDVLLEVIQASTHPGASTSTSSEDAARSAKFVRIFKLLKIGRALRLRKMLTMVQRILMLSNALMEMWQFVFIIHLYVHFSACLFFALGFPSSPNKCVGWNASALSWFDISSGSVPNSMPWNNSLDMCGSCRTNSWGRKDCLTHTDLRVTDSVCLEEQISGCEYARMGLNKSPSQRLAAEYLAAFYWSIVTMTTIGYGDILPTSHVERLGIVCMLALNAGIFAYSVTTICDLALNLNANANFVNKRRDEVIHIVTQHNISRILRKKCLRFFNFKNELSMAQFAMEEEYFENMGRQCALDVCFLTLRRTIQMVPMFQNCSDDFIRNACVCLELEVFVPDDYIIYAEEALAYKSAHTQTHHKQFGTQAQGETVRRFYIMQRGIAQLVDAQGKPTSGDNIYWYGTGALFEYGEFCYPSPLKARTYINAYSFHAQSFKHVLRNTGISMAYFEHDLCSRGEFTLPHASRYKLQHPRELKPSHHLSIYDDWKPVLSHGTKRLSPRLGIIDPYEVAERLRDDEAQMLGKETALTRLKEHRTAQQALISQLVMRKDRHGPHKAHIASATRTTRTARTALGSGSPLCDDVDV